MTAEAASELLTGEAYFCRVSGEGSADYRVCLTEKEVMAFYEEMFGKDYDGTVNGEIEHFRNSDNWALDHYHVDLYCAQLQVWRVPISVLANRRASRPEVDAERVREIARKHCINTGQGTIATMYNIENAIYEALSERARAAG